MSDHVGEVWTTRQAAEHCGCKPTTYTYYVRTKRAPARLPYRSATGEMLHDAGSVRDWHAARPGKGARTDRAKS